MRSKEEIKQELEDIESHLTRQRQQAELQRQLILEYKERRRALLWVLGKEENDD